MDESESSDTIRVDQWDQYASARAPLSIETTGLGPCVGVIIYNKKTKQAFVGHFIHTDTDEKNVRKLLTDATKKADMSDLHVWLGGGDVSDPDPNQRQYVRDSRNFILELIKQYGFSADQQEVHWNEGFGDQAVSMHIDTNTGEVRYEVSDLLGEEWDEE